MLNSFSTLRLGSGCPERSRSGKVIDIKVKFFGLLLILIITLVTINSAQAISNKLNYQGRLLDKNGNAVSKTISVKFSIYDNLTSGTIFWSETKDIAVADGYFSTILGDTTTLNLDFGSNDYYLGVKFGDDSEMTPRKYIGSAPFAINASKLSGASAGTSANNVLKLGNSGNIDIAGEIKTTGSLNVGSSSLASLTVSGTTNLNGTFQLNGTTISASVTELNYIDGVTSGIQGQLDSKLTLAGGTMAGTLVMNGNNITGINQLALNAISSGTTTTGYIYYDTEDNAFYGRTNAGWINFAADGGDITSVTAGTGLTGGGLSGDLTLNVAAADGTITVNADSIQVGAIGSANITDGAIVAADLASDSVEAAEIATNAVTTTEILDDTITNTDINNAAAIDSTKIAAGTVDNTELGYLNGVTSALQTQLDAKLALAGGNMAGNINLAANSLTGTAAAIDFNEFDVSSVTGSITINDGADLGQISVEGTIFDVNSLDFTAAGTISSGGASFLNFNPGSAAVYNLSAGGTLWVDAASNDNTYTSGALRVDVDTTTTDNIGIALTYSPNGANGDKTFYGQEITLSAASNIAAADNLYGLIIRTGNALDAGNIVDAGIYISHSMANTVNDGILINNTDVLGGVITDGIDVSDTEIINAINIGANSIEGTNFDVDGNGNITIAAAQGLDTNAAGDLEIGATNATSVSIGAEDTTKPVYLKGPIGGFSTWSGRETGAWTNGDPSTITVNLAGMDANDLVIITPVTRTVNAEGTLDYWVTSNAGSFTVSSSSSAGAFTETMDFNWIVIRQ